MRSNSLIYILFPLFIFSSGSYGQLSQNAGDTILLTRIGKVPGNYQVTGTRVENISILFQEPSTVNNVNYSIGGNLGRGAFTLFTGIGTGAARDVDWNFHCLVETNDPQYNWQSDIFCPGAVIKNTNRVKNNDGSRSVETTYEKEFYWQQGAVGFIIEAGDTIGRYWIIMNPRTDSGLVKWKDAVYHGAIRHDNNPFQQTREFAFAGEFRGQESALFFNSDENKVYIFSATGLVGIYQYDRFQAFVKKKKRVNPYILIKNDCDGRMHMDILRLAMAGQWFKDTIDPSYLMKQ